MGSDWYPVPVSFPPPTLSYRAATWDSLMELALDEARGAVVAGDVPVGAVVVGQSGNVLALARNRREQSGDPTAHAEVLALRSASLALSSRSTTFETPPWRLTGCTVIVTLEPCLMCAGALLAARVDRLVFGAWDPKAGACGSVWDVVRDTRGLHQLEVIPGVRAAESAELLADFFEKRR